MGASLLSLATWFLRRRIAAFFGFLLTRLRRERLLDHPRREALAATVQARPGIPLASLRATFDGSNNAFEHHLRLLIRHGFLHRVGHAGRVFLYPCDSGVAALPLPRVTPDSILSAVHAHPGRAENELTALVGLPVKRIRYHVLKLARAGRLELVRDGNAARAYPLGHAPRDMNRHLPKAGNASVS